MGTWRTLRPNAIRSLIISIFYQFSFLAFACGEKCLFACPARINFMNLQHFSVACLGEMFFDSQQACDWGQTPGRLKLKLWNWNYASFMHKSVSKRGAVHANRITVHKNTLNWMSQLRKYLKVAIHTAVRAQKLKQVLKFTYAFGIFNNALVIYS